MNQSLDRLAREIGKQFELELERVGFLFRIFFRAKSEDSIARKLRVKNYGKQGNVKRMQDLIGIRITLYFADDLETVYRVLRALPNYVDETVDHKTETIFKPERINLIFRLNARQSREVKDVLKDRINVVDLTFELQLRTVLSEGWHEVDHDLRYKCAPDWAGFSDIARTFNGVYASLVTSDWSILKIFEQLAYQHYKTRNWTAMLRHKLRLRLGDDGLSKEILLIFDQDLELAKKVFRIERIDLIESMYSKGVRMPLNLSNIVFLINALMLNDERIWKLTPSVLKNYLMDTTSNGAAQGDAPS